MYFLRSLSASKTITLTSIRFMLDKCSSRPIHG